MAKVYSFVLALVVFFFLVTGVNAEKKVDCGIVTESISLEKDISSDGTCFTVGANNLVIDGAGFTIAGNGTGFGIDNDGGFDNITIKNFGGIKNFTNSIKATGMLDSRVENNYLEGGPSEWRVQVLHGSIYINPHALNLASVDRIIISGNIIKTTGRAPSYSAGIYIGNSNSTLVTSNFVEAFGYSGGPSIYLYGTRNSSITSNLIKGVGSAIGISDGASNYISFNNATITERSNNHVIVTYSSNNTQINNNIINATLGSNGLALNSANNSEVFSNTIFSSSGYENAAIYLKLSNSNSVRSNYISDSGSYYGVFSEASNFNTISNNIIEKSGTYGTAGIFLKWANFTEVFSNNINASTRYESKGILSYYSEANNISSNKITIGSPRGYGVSLQSSDNFYMGANIIIVNSGAGIDVNYNSKFNTIDSNNITARDGMGILLTHSTDSSIRRNILDTKSYPIYVYSGTQKRLDNYRHTIDETNTIKGKKILYIFNQSFTRIENRDDIGQVLIAASKGIVIKNLSVESGVLLHFTENSSISDNFIKSRSIGLEISFSNFSKTERNKIETSGESGYGLHLTKSNSIELLNNTVTTSGLYGYGIFGDQISSNKVSFNNIKTLNRSSSGVYFYSSENPGEVTENSIETSGEEAHGLYYITSPLSSIKNNKIKTSGREARGILLQYLSNSTYVDSNSIEALGEYSSGIYVSSSPNSTTTLNNVTALSRSSYGIIYDDVPMAKVEFNRINISGESRGIFIPYDSTNSTIFSNTVIISSGIDSKGISVESKYNNITGNSINSGGQENYGVHLAGQGYNHLFNNSLSVDDSSGYSSAIHLASNWNNITSNNINISGQYNYGVFISGANNTVVLSDIMSDGYGGTKGIYVDRGGQNTFEINNIRIKGDNSVGVELDYGAGSFNRVGFSNILVDGAYSQGIETESQSNMFADNNVSVYGENSIGVLFNDNNNTLSGGMVSSTNSSEIVSYSENTFENLLLPEDVNITFGWVVNSFVADVNLAQTPPGGRGLLTGILSISSPLNFNLTYQEKRTAGLIENSARLYGLEDDKWKLLESQTVDTGKNFITATIETGSIIGAFANKPLEVSIDLKSPSYRDEISPNITVEHPDIVSSVEYRYENDTINGDWVKLDKKKDGKDKDALDISGLSEGEYRIRVNATDDFGNSNSSVTKSFRVDLTPPIITILSPINTTYATEMIDLNAFSSEDGYSWYSVNGRANITIDPERRVRVPGTATVFVYYNDSAGNVGSASVSFTTNNTISCDQVCGLCNTEDRCQSSRKSCTWLNSSVCQEDISKVEYGIGGLVNTTGYFDFIPVDCSSNPDKCDSQYNIEKGYYLFETSCLDGDDNDEDGLKDCEDKDCLIWPSCSKNYNYSKLTAPRISSFKTHTG